MSDELHPWRGEPLDYKEQDPQHKLAAMYELDRAYMNVLIIQHKARRKGERDLCAESALEQMEEVFALLCRPAHQPEEGK